MRSSIYITVLMVVLLGCGQKEKESVTAPATQPTVPTDSVAPSPAPASEYTYQLIAAPENTFGYDVFKDQTLFIHQPHIPGMPGVKGFAREEQAKKAAELMIEKMNKGIVPPTLSEDEINTILKN